MSAAISPASSATPTPIIATKTTATTLKPAKLLTNDEKMNRMPSALEQALDLGGLLDDLELGVGVVARASSAGSGTTDPPTYSCSAATGGWLGDVVGDADVERGEDRRQHDHEHAQAEEDDRRVGHLVADPLDAVEHPLRRVRRFCRAGFSAVGQFGGRARRSSRSGAAKSTASCGEQPGAEPGAPGGLPAVVGSRLWAVPAMSMCAHGTSPTNSARNSAAVIAPALAPPRFLRSATVESSSLR